MELQYTFREEHALLPVQLAHTLKMEPRTTFALRVMLSAQPVSAHQPTAATPAEISHLQGLLLYTSKIPLIRFAAQAVLKVMLGSHLPTRVSNAKPAV